MATGGAIESAVGTTRGFLFADLRDFTAFVERAGNAKAAELLAQYRDLVREEVARHSGAEIRTEGDSFYVVFRSASNAVDCGLAITERARRTSAERPDRPIRVGIGIHAGETVETDEGYVGHAVNLAARVASQARPWEVLVTETVRSLVAGSIQVTFVNRGRHRFKGIAEEMRVYAVASAEGALVPTGRRRSVRSWLAAAGLAVAAAIGLALVFTRFAAAPVAPSQSAVPTNTASATAAAVTQLPKPDPSTPFRALDPGRYALTLFRPQTEFTVMETGWSVSAESVDAFELLYGNPPAGVGYVGGDLVQVVFTDDCLDDGSELVKAGPHALIDWLSRHRQLDVTEPRPSDIGGYRAVEVEIEPNVVDGAGCWPVGTPPEERLLHLWPVGGTTFRLGPAERARVLSVDIPQHPLTIVVGAFEFAAFDGFVDRAAPVTASMSFTP